MFISTPPRLFIMMFMQYFLQGAWSMTMGLVLSTFGMSTIIGSSYAILGLATILSPLFIGMVADRFFAAQKVMGSLHLINAVIFLFIPQLIKSHNEIIFLFMIFIVGILFYPTAALANSISFRHIDGVKIFPVIRVFGTFGFMVIGFILGEYGFSGSTMTWHIASLAAVVLGLYCFTLPNTPPKAKGEKFMLRDLFCLDALSLFKDKNFSIFMLSTFLLMIPKTTYVAYIPVFLKTLGYDNSASMFQLGTISEIVFMLFLSIILVKFGFKKIIVLGAICWIIRCFLLSQESIYNNTLLIIIALLLHGICWDFFFTAGDIYVDSKAGEKIKAQAQSLRFIVSNGIGVMFASLVSGHIFNSTVKEPELLAQWHDFWLYPMVIAAVVSVLFFVFFNEKSKVKTAYHLKKDSAV